MVRGGGPVQPVAVWGAVGVVAAQAVGLALLDRQPAAWCAGVALAVALVVVRRLLGRGHRSHPMNVETDDSPTGLTRWVERTESQIVWADTSRADWDRRLRPMLARQFELASQRPRTRNPAAFQSTGRVLFGDELWAWVDPDNISPTGTRERGPGRATFTEIIERLERL